ncbi:MAG: ribose 5-phosphate isomerase A [Tepidisphaera sp.]|nr:ribose 5-phosphate isomerase A [Tepidisphaera sp.]
MTDHTSSATNSSRGWSPEHGPGGLPDLLAKAAVAEITSGMVVGLGTGRYANRAIRALAQRMRDEKLDIDCVCSSLSTETLARELSLPIVSFNDVESLDYCFDGADEVDHQCRMMKGHHGAITRQRLLAAVSRRCVYLANEDKLVDHLGKRSLLAVTIIPFGIESTRNRLREMGLSGVVRRTLDGEVFSSDGGGVILDMRIPETCDVEQLSLELDHVAGVVDHGLFLTEADEVLVEMNKGTELKKIVAPQGADTTA